MAYLTRFEDYYKSSDEEEEDSSVSQPRFAPPPPVRELTVQEQLQLTDDEEEMEEEEGIEGHNGDNGDWSHEDRDWVPQSLVDLKLRIKAPVKVPSRSVKSTSRSLNDKSHIDTLAEMAEMETISERVFSNNYDEVCKFQCNLCQLEVPTDNLKSHMKTQHEGEEGLVSYPRYHTKTWHRCGLCGKEILFTRQKLRQHVSSAHSLSIQDYNEKFMINRKRAITNSDPTKRRKDEEWVTASHGDLGDVDISEVNENELSDSYADLVKVECRACNKQVEQDNFRFVHLKKHGMDLEGYKKLYGVPSIVRMAYHRCHVCGQVFLFTRSRLGAHLVRHKMSVRDYGNRFMKKILTDRRKPLVTKVDLNNIDTNCMFSNDYEDECSTLCKICARHLSYGSLGSHIYQVHGLKMKAYIEKFGEVEILRKSYHECGICGETMLFIRYHISQHVKSKHGLSIQAYNKAHMQIHNVEYADCSTDKGRKIGTQKAPQWCDGTMYRCPYCFTLYYRYFTFRIHLINSHKITNTEDRSACVKENEIITDVYRCKVCFLQLKRDRMDIEAHLKQAHRTTIKVYDKNFENGANPRESVTDAIARLVKDGLMEERVEKYNKGDKNGRNSLSLNSSIFVKGGLGGDGAINDKKQNKTEYIDVKNETSVGNVEVKIEPVEDQEQSVNVTSIVREVIKDEELVVRKRKRKLPARFVEEPCTNNASTPVSKLAKVDTHIGSPVDEEMQNKSPPKSVKLKFISNPQTPPKKLNGNSSMQAAPRSPPVGPRSPPSCSLPPRAAKLSHSLVTVRHTQNLNSTIKKESERNEGIIYRCPLDCTWTCGKEGMRQGPAVLHLLRAHSIQPDEMRLKGIRFLKTPA